MAMAAAAGPPKVPLALYYESLCPYCSRFIVNHLAGIFKNGLIDAVDILLVPYGNAHVRGANNTISCQHGPYECLLNNVEACAIDAWPDLNVHFGFIHCVEGLVMNKKREEWESCFQKQNLDPKPVMECYNNERGQKVGSYDAALYRSHTRLRELRGLCLQGVQGSSSQGLPGAEPSVSDRATGGEGGQRRQLQLLRCRAR